MLVTSVTTILACQPIYANDTWVHLALGRAFAADGPWLAHDPHLYTAPGPPSPSSWLGSVAIHAAYSATGLTGLRIAHGLFVLLILALAWRVVRHAGASRAGASAGLVCFVVLATYRIVQLRPDLFTIATVLALPLLFIGNDTGPGPRRLAIAGLLGALWANVHAAFVLGPVLLVAAGLAAWLSSFVGGTPADRVRDRVRGPRIAAAGIAMWIGSLANPQGATAFLAYAASGAETPGLETISDEWNPTNLLAWPTPSLPPSVAAWLLVWICVIGLAAVTIRFALESLRREATRKSFDPALLALALAGLGAAVLASRFLWLGIFTLALLGRALAAARPPGGLRLGFPIASVAAIAAAIAHFAYGDWLLVSRSLLSGATSYLAPYSAERFNTTTAWFLADSGVTGRLFNDYPQGGFLSFWLAPEVQLSSSGTMNVAKAAMDANLAISWRKPMHAGEGYGALLDRQGTDLFLGLGFPIEATPGRPIPCTVRHLQSEPGWMLVFRNLRSAVYLRRNLRNEANLARIEAFFARAGVPFDRERGFDPESVLRTAPSWAAAHGLVPGDFSSLVEAAESDLEAGRFDIRSHRLAVVFAVLGLYERAIAVDERILRLDPANPDSAWRVVWSLLQLDRVEEAIRFTRGFERLAGRTNPGAVAPWSSLLDRMLVMDPDSRAAVGSHLPLLRSDQLEWVRNGVAVLPARSDRPRPRP